MAQQIEETTAITITPMGMLEVAVRQNADLDKLSKLMDLQERWERNEARKAFVVAMSAFKAESISVVKDKINKQYSTGGSEARYVTLGNLVGTVTPYLSKHGLSARWDIDQSNGIKVSCLITHVMGHSESVSMVVPADKSGAKNPIQEIKSSITYAKACTFESITGLAASDANLEDDGNGASTPDWLRKAVDDMNGALSRSQMNEEFQHAYKRASEEKNKAAQTLLIATKNAWGTK